jgi:hypothetical protein
MTMDWGLPPQDTPPETPAVPATAETPAQPVTPAPRRAQAVTPLEINPARRRRDSDLIVEPGDDVRAMARLLGQDLADFIAIAVANHLDHHRAKLRA